MKLEGIKPGDVLAIDKTYSSDVDLHVVERLTNTQAVTVKGIRVALKDGKVICSSGYSVRYARIPTDKDILEHRIDVATGRLRNFFVTADSIEAFLKGQS